MFNQKNGNGFGWNQQEQQSTVSGTFGKTWPPTTTSSQSTLPFGTITTENPSNSSLFETKTPSLFNNTHQSPTVDIFGNNIQTTNNKRSIFGEPSKPPIFGEPSKKPIFGEQNKTPTFGESSKTPKFGEQNKTPIFGTTFKPNKGNGIFGKANIGDDFGNQQVTVANDSGIIKYHPTFNTEIIPETGRHIKLKQNCICFMKQYENKNFEEIRLEDYSGNDIKRVLSPPKMPQTNYNNNFGYSCTGQNGIFGVQHTGHTFGDQFNNQFNSLQPKFTFGVPPDVPVYQLPNPPFFNNNQQRHFEMTVPYKPFIKTSNQPPPPFPHWPNQQPQKPFEIKPIYATVPPHPQLCAGYIFPERIIQQPSNQPPPFGLESTQKPVEIKPISSTVPHSPYICGGYIYPERIIQQPQPSAFDNNLALAPKPKMVEVINPVTGQPYTYGIKQPAQAITETNANDEKKKITDDKDSESSAENNDNNSNAQPPPQQPTPPPQTPAIFLCIAINNLTINMNTK